ncbi:MAG: thiol reductase thioredoxin [Chloroflexi bacterium]|nr:thiol reductase thioredoxin [Chloroflexota bacterium]
MDDKRQVVCTQCEAINRLLFEQLDGKLNCGKCHQPLVQEKSVILNAGNFQRHIARNDILVLVEFGAEWCGYCQKMAPAFGQTANHLEPFVRLATINTEAYPGIAAQYAVSSLPTLILFRGNKEIARQAGALTVEQIVA